MNVENTDSFRHLAENICKSKEQADIVKRILEDTSSIYLWMYHTATDRQTYENAKNGASLAIFQTIKLLRNIGELTLADDVEKALIGHPEDSTSVLTKNKVLSQARHHIEERMLASGMSKSKYDRQYAKHMKEAFIEHCNQQEAEDEPPPHFDSNFEPSIY